MARPAGRSVRLSKGRRRGFFWRFAWRLLALGVVVLLVLCIPVAYVELACRRPAISAGTPYTPVITDAASARREANTYLTYPEWHIVYAYDGLAETLKHGDEYAFDYISSVVGFWRSSCALMEVADGHGGADWSTRSMIHTIGVSFTLEMALKGLYEETFGRATALLRGAKKTPQDQVVATMAIDYSAFLRQTPWYRYPFTREARKLWDAPFSSIVRGWERRLGIGAEFYGKSAYAQLIAVAAAADPAPLTIRSIVSGLDRKALSAIDGVTIVGARGKDLEIETPRYDLFTKILVAIAQRGGTVVEIAGNDDIMATLTVAPKTTVPAAPGHVILRMPRSGFTGERLLVDVKVKDLAPFLKSHPLGDPGLEHVFDY